MTRSFSLGLLIPAALLVACSGPAGDKGEKGDPAAAPTPGGNTTGAASAGFVFPDKGLLGRDNTEVIVTVANAQVDASTTVDFGAGVTATSIKAISPTALKVQLSIANDAAVGAHDVTVTVGKNSYSAKEAFEVIPPLDIKVAGAPKQGGLFTVQITNRDIIPFDSKFSIPSSEDLLVLSHKVNAFDAQYVFLAAPKAKVGKIQLEGKNPSGLSYVSTADAINVTAGTIADLAAGDFSLSGGTDSKTLKWAVPAAGAKGAIATLKVSVPDTFASPFALVYGAGGTNADIFAQGQGPTEPGFFGPQPLPPPYDMVVSYPMAASDPAADKYFVLFDLEGKGTLKLTPTILTANTLFAEGATDHATPAAATDLGAMPAAAAGGIILTGEAKTASETDSYKFPAAANDKFEISVLGALDADVYIVGKPAASTTFADTDLQKALAHAEGAADMATSVLTQDAVKAASLDGGKLYLVVKPYAQGKATGKYTVSIRKL